MGEKETEDSAGENDQEARKAGQVKAGINADGGGSIRAEAPDSGGGAGVSPPPSAGPPPSTETAIIKSKSNITNN